MRLTVILTICLSFVLTSELNAQSPPVKEPWGPKDTIIVSVINYEGELIPYGELEMVYVSNLSDKELAKAIEKYDKLRRAVYVTYPYARTAGATINDVNAHLAHIKSKSARKDYIKSREKELRTQFAAPLEKMTVYQGKVLMKLINRQTGNECYDLIKEFKGGLNARMYQTVAFFFGSSLKQSYDINDAYDRQIENIVREIDGSWYNATVRQVTR
jgi:benzoyl-CoA reductase/2-hydroxyglutaryl-CoA dehydratase subunit BcrC/BadD/HgdB